MWWILPQENKSLHVSFYLSQLWIWRKRVPELGLNSSYVFTFNSLFYMVNTYDAPFLDDTCLGSWPVVKTKPSQILMAWTEILRVNLNCDTYLCQEQIASICFWCMQIVQHCFSYYIRICFNIFIQTY